MEVGQKHMARIKQQHSKAREERRPAPIRLLTAVPICDGHDSAINAINLEFIRHGLEVVYLGYNRSARDIVRAAIQEDVRAIGISSYNGGHVEFFTEVVGRLREAGAGDIKVFGGGGGTITPADAQEMQRHGVERIFFAGTSLGDLAGYANGFGEDGRSDKGVGKDRAGNRGLARTLTAVVDGEEEAKKRREVAPSPQPSPRLLREGVRAAVGLGPLTLGFTGPGGVGKTLLIDELVLRFLRSDPEVQIAILSHDPSILGNGALLGDRASMIHSQNDRVFMRSLATRGQAGGLSAATARCLEILKSAQVHADGRGFDVILVETVGIGQEALPYGGLVDKSVLVMSPDYGARLQLQKIVMLEAADVVVVNKSDLAGAKTASTEIGQRLASNGRGQRLVGTTAKRHRDVGVDELFEVLAGERVSGIGRDSL